ncbi:MAG TPA: TonB-dependent receptor, partial [Caulobacteraceae bacterium]|nr:TonB-dependent receptor [Caulobacteraceae bacterium]
TLKITGGLRYTVDKKHAPRIPSELLVEFSAGYPTSEIVDQEWREPTGRLTIDWKPDLALTDETLLYASYAHGYKAGGANPPPPVVAAYGDFYGAADIVVADQNTHPKTFGPEFVDAFEVGAKNTLLDGRLTLNADVFYYDYTGYQISQIVNRSAINLNFDAKVWGAEVEADWRPVENLRLGFKGGFENTRLADGSRAIDLMDRTAGDPNYVVIKNFPTLPSNCIVPYDFVAPSGGSIVGWLTCESLFIEGNHDYGLDPATVPNNGEGIFKDLSGNELPNAPRFTGTLTADYTLPLPNAWLMTLHSDLYYQSEAWTRVFNMDGYDKLKAYTNVNLAAIFNNEDAGWQVMAYVKNVFDRDSITGAFLNSDDTGLTTNVFLTEPRLYGLRVTKRWSGDWSWYDAARRDGPYPLTVEIGGAVTRFDAPNEPVAPAFVESFTSPDLHFPLETQQEDLDWGDGREVAITWAPTGTPWSVSAAFRHAETNGRATVLIGKQATGGLKFPQSLIDANPFLAPYQSYVPGGMNYVRDDVRDREEHTLVDFFVGREVGLGSFAKSRLKLGLRYAQFKSSTRMDLGGVNGMPDLEDGVIVYQYYTQFHQYAGTAAADRKFTGAGPMLSWDASKALLGDDETGRVSLEAGVSGAVLFGNQEATATYETVDTLKRRRNVSGYMTILSTDPAASGGHARSGSATVYSLGANLGLSYAVGRMKVSGGYRIDRFYNVLDGGVNTPKDEDRTIDGPYFKIAVGFGG